jgi:hypothetical protein
MAFALTSTLTLRPALTYTRTRNGTLQTWITPFGSAVISLTSGTGSGQANRLYDSQRTLAASTSEELDLAGDATFLDAFEQAITFVKVKMIYVKAASANTNNVIVGGAASNAFLGAFGDATDTQVLQPGCVYFVVHPTTGWTVTAGSVDKLKVANSGAGTSVTYDIALVGTDA